MKNLSELKQHLNAVRQTRQITNAMYLLSTARMKQSMQNIDYNLLYMRRLRAAMKDVLSKTKHSEIRNRFIEQQPRGKAMFVVVTADKGMCGGYNADLIRLALEKTADFKQPILCSFGNVGTQMLISRGTRPDYVWNDALQHPSFDTAREVAQILTDLYLEHEINEVYVVYTEYQNSAVQTPVCRRLLPLLRRDFSDVEYEYRYSTEIIYEPSVEDFFNVAVPQYMIGFMYEVFMQSSASENAARMASMQNATRNADRMIAELEDEINAARQLAITNEIIEIAAASEIKHGA